MLRLYRALAGLLLPASFFEAYGSEMQESVAARLSAVDSRLARVLLLAGEILDLLRTSVREWWWEAKGGAMAPDGGGRPSLGRGPRRLRPGEATLQDVRYALRQMRRAPGFSLLVVLTLAVGIGLNTAVFSGVHALLLRDLAGVEAPERLVQVHRTWPGIEYGSNSIPHYRDLRQRGESVFAGVAAWSFVTLSLGWDGWSEVAVGQMVSDNFFEVLGVEAAIGRTWRSEDTTGTEDHPAVVLSHRAWQQQFGGDSDILRRLLHINGTPFRVIGIAPAGFKGVADVYSPTLWAPLARQPQLQPGREDRPENRNSNFLKVIARLQPDAGLEATRAAARAILEGLRQDYPDVYEGTGIRLVPQPEVGIRAAYGDAEKDFAALLMAVVGLLLLLACANVANMFLAKAQQRRREISLRLSIGAGRSRILRQLLTESLLFALLAALGGLALASVAVDVLNGIRLPTHLPLDVGFELSLPVLLFALGTALATVTLFGLAPALQASRLGASCVSGKARGGVGGTSPLSAGLVVAQTALAVVLLLGAGVFLRSLWAATRIDLGFQADHLLSARLSPGLLGYDRRSTEDFTRRLGERLAAQPGVVRVSWADTVPLALSVQRTRVAVTGYEPAPGEQMSLDYARIGPGYFETMGIPLRRGRGITAADDSTAAGVVVVNRTMAERFWPGQSAIGRTVQTQGSERRVVGVAEDGKYRSLGEEPIAFMYIALAQDFRAARTVLVRATRDPAELAPVLRRAVLEVDPAMPVRSLRTMANHVGMSLFPARAAAVALGLFGILGLLLSTVGIYGVIAYTTSRRTREIGIRVALGAEPGRVLALVLGRGAGLTTVGLGLGLLLSLAGMGAVRSLLYTSRAVDPVAFIGVPALLGTVALIATWIPARRASRTDPVQALKAE